MTRESNKIIISLPQAVREQLVNNLYNTEEVLWAATPCFKRTDDYGGLYYFIAIVMFAVAAIMYHKCVSEKMLSGDMMIVIIFVALIGCGAFLMPAYQFSVAKRTGYVITNRRAIIIKPDSFWSLSTKSYPLTVGLIVEVKMDGTRGDIIFGESVAGYLTSHLGNGINVTTPSKQKYGFLKCPDAKKVANFIYEYAQYLANNN